MVDVAPFGKIVKTHDSTNLHYGTNINLEQLELARFVAPFRLPTGRHGDIDAEVKTKNRKSNIRPCGTNMFYLLFTPVGLCPIRRGLSNSILRNYEPGPSSRKDRLALRKRKGAALYHPLLPSFFISKKTTFSLNRKIPK
jgi:hypothetical protein